MNKNWSAPRSRLIVWMGLHRRLNTLDRVARWNSDVDTGCLMCGLDNESNDHILFQCKFAKDLRLQLRSIAGIMFDFASFDEEIFPMSKLIVGRHLKLNSLLLYGVKCFTTSRCVEIRWFFRSSWSLVRKLLIWSCLEFLVDLMMLGKIS